MLSILGNWKPACHGLTSREWLQAGGLSLFGPSLADLLEREAQVADKSRFAT